MLIDYDGAGEREAIATAYTLMLYEQEFKADDAPGVTGNMIADVFGIIDLRKARTQVDAFGNVVVLDYTNDNWPAYLRALWAMLRTSSESKRARGIDVPLTPRYEEWVKTVGQVNMSEIMSAVMDECNRGLFRAGATDSGTTGERRQEAGLSVHDGDSNAHEDGNDARRDD